MRKKESESEEGGELECVLNDAFGGLVFFPAIAERVRKGKSRCWVDSLTNEKNE